MLLRVPKTGPIPYQIHAALNIKNTKRVFKQHTFCKNCNKFWNIRFNIMPLLAKTLRFPPIYIGSPNRNIFNIWSQVEAAISSLNLLHALPATNMNPLKCWGGGRVVAKVSPSFEYISKRQRWIWFINHVLIWKLSHLKYYKLVF